MERDCRILRNLLFDNSLEYESVPVYVFKFFEMEQSRKGILQYIQNVKEINWNIDFDYYVGENEKTKEFVKEQEELEYYH